MKKLPPNRCAKLPSSLSPGFNIHLLIRAYFSLDRATTSLWYADAIDFRLIPLPPLIGRSHDSTRVVGGTSPRGRSAAKGNNS
jgi:hypothetical protein